MTDKLTNIAKLYAWIADNDIDIVYDDDLSLLEAIAQQITSESLEPSPELMEILTEIRMGEIMSGKRLGSRR